MRDPGPLRWYDYVVIVCIVGMLVVITLTMYVESTNR